MEKSLFQYVTRNCFHRYIKDIYPLYAVRENVWNERLVAFRSVYILRVRVTFEKTGKDYSDTYSELNSLYIFLHYRYLFYALLLNISGE